MTARASFSHDSRIVKMPLPNSVLLKDYLLDDLSSCSSNGFRSYPRRQFCTTVRYLIEIDLNKHVKLPPTQKKLLKSKLQPQLKEKAKPVSIAKSKLKSAVVNVFKKFQFSGSGSGSGGNRTKGKFLPRNLSQKLSKRGFWKKSTDQNRKEFEWLNSFHEVIKQNTSPGGTATNVEMKTSSKTSSSKSISISNSNNSTSSDSYFTVTSNCSPTGGYANVNVAQNKESEQLAVEHMKTENGETVVAVTTATATTTDNAKKNLQGEEKDIFSPNSVIDFPCDNDDEDEDEVTSPFQHSPFYAKGCKRKLMSKVQRAKSLARLNPVRLEDRITLAESRTHGSMLDSLIETQRELAAEKNAIALLQLLKATMSSHDLSNFATTEHVLIGFFTERFVEGNVSNYMILQEAKDWINGETKDMFEPQYNKLTYIKEMEKRVKWLEYKEEETREVVSEVEYEVFTSLVEDTLLEILYSYLD